MCIGSKAEVRRPCPSKGSENGQAGRHTFYRTGQSDHFRVVTPKSLVMAPDDAEQTIMVGRLDCAVTNRDGTGRSRWLTAARRWPVGGAGGSHGPAAPVACSEPGGPPIRGRRPKRTKKYAKEPDFSRISRASWKLGQCCRETGDFAAYNYCGQPGLAGTSASRLANCTQQLGALTPGIILRPTRQLL